MKHKNGNGHLGMKFPKDKYPNYANRNKEFTDDWKKNLSISHRGYVMPEAQKNKISAGVRNSESHAQGVGTEKNRIRHRELMLERLENGTASKRLFNTKPELKMKDILRDIGLRVGKAKEANDVVFQKRLHNNMLDFWHRKLNLYIHVDGDYHHNLPEIIELDKKVDEMILKEGAWYIRFWSHDIMENTESVKNTLIGLGVTYM